ncbi:unnamed protein product [Rhizophagus irregularis]|nr:unnamed protein product [Rhizophagus irregularis]
MDFLHLSDAATGANGDLLEHHLKISITEFHQTQSSVYSSFHKTARTINFNIGYSKEKEGEWRQNYHLALPSTMQELSDCDPYVIFSLFYSSEILNIIVKNMYNRKGKG